jgi:hypothetical protein
MVTLSVHMYIDAHMYMQDFTYRDPQRHMAHEWSNLLRQTDRRCGSGTYRMYVCMYE